MVRVVVTGGEELRVIEARLINADATIEKAVRERLKPIPRRFADLVVEEIPTHIPSGYRDTLAESIHYRTTQNRVGMIIAIRADGKIKRRELPAINRGSLRHPLFGDRTRWYATRVRAGVVDDAATRLEPEVEDAIAKARDDLANDITREGTP